MQERGACSGGRERGLADTTFGRGSLGDSPFDDVTQLPKASDASLVRPADRKVEELRIPVVNFPLELPTGVYRVDNPVDRSGRLWRIAEVMDDVRVRDDVVLTRVGFARGLPVPEVTEVKPRRGKIPECEQPIEGIQCDDIAGHHPGIKHPLAVPV